MTTDHFTFHITDESDASDKPYFTPEAPQGHLPLSCPSQ